MLQWGRGLSTPEISYCRTMPSRSPGASMGPGSFDPGNSRLARHDPRRRSASMGPGSFDPGNRQRGRNVGKFQRASMGPGSFDPGNARSSFRRRTDRPSFNGAGVFRPRKFAQMAKEDLLADALQWGRGLSTPEIACLWKSSLESIELQWGRGLSTPEMYTWRRQETRNRRFNGAGVFRPRKYPPPLYG